MNDLILGHAKRSVLAHYDHSKRIPERALWLRGWADFVAESASPMRPTFYSARSRECWRAERPAIGAPFLRRTITLT